MLRALWLQRLLPGGGGHSDRCVQPCVLLQQRILSTASLYPSAAGSVVRGIPQAGDHKVVSLLVFSRVEMPAGYSARLQWLAIRVSHPNGSPLSPSLWGGLVPRPILVAATSWSLQGDADVGGLRSLQPHQGYGTKLGTEE